MLHRPYLRWLISHLNCRRSPEEAVVHAVLEARRAAPAILHLPHLQLWWDTAPPSLRATLWMLLADLPGDLPLLLMASADVPFDQLDEVLILTLSAQICQVGRSPDVCRVTSHHSLLWMLPANIRGNPPCASWPLLRCPFCSTRVIPFVAKPLLNGCCHCSYTVQKSAQRATVLPSFPTGLKAWACCICRPP